MHVAASVDIAGHDEPQRPGAALKGSAILLPGEQNRHVAESRIDITVREHDLLAIVRGDHEVDRRQRIARIGGEGEPVRLQRVVEMNTCELMLFWGSPRRCRRRSRFRPATAAGQRPTPGRGTRSAPSDTGEAFGEASAVVAARATSIELLDAAAILTRRPANTANANTRRICRPSPRTPRYAMPPTTLPACRA